MPLPAYMTKQPDISPIDAVAARIRRLGHDVVLHRRGRTVVMGGVETATAGHEGARRAIRIACEHADSERLTIETAVPEITADVVDDYRSNGFRIVAEIGSDEDERGAHVLMRRAAA